MNNIFIRNFFIPLCVIILAACENDKEEVAVAQPMSAFLQANPNVSLFGNALERAGLQSFYNGPGPFTFFAPTNEAFAAAGITPDSINKMSVGALNYILQYHIINGSVTGVDLLGTQYSFPRGSQIGNTAATQLFLGSGGPDSSYVNGVNIISRDNRISSGVVHVINRVLAPPVLRGNVQSVINSTGQHTLFSAAITKANRWTTLTATGPFTVLAPTDAAMNAAGLTAAAINAATVGRIDSIIRYHYISGFRLFTNDLGNRNSPPTALGLGRTLLASANGRRIKGAANANPVSVVGGNLLGTNGVVHAIDGVLAY